MRANGPAENRRMVQSLVIITILVWATQTLLSQWGFGADVNMTASSGELFITSNNQLLRSASVELQAEAVVSGSSIKLKQIARWPELDDTVMESAGDVVVARLEKDAKTHVLDIDQVTAALEKAGISLALINFRGSRECRVSRSSVWLEDAAPAKVAPVAAKSGSTVGAMSMPAKVEAVAVEQLPPRTLREILANELAERLMVPADSLVIKFNTRDEKLVSLCEPLFRFEIEPRRQRGLGDITWDVKIISDDNTQNASVTANVRMWQMQLLAARPIAVKQILSEQDMTERRVQVDRLNDGIPLTLRHAVGQQAARDINVGTPITSQALEAVQMVRLGEYVNVSVDQGMVRLNWVAEAREHGALGQTIKVRNTQTRQEFFMTVTGPQRGKMIGSDIGREAAVTLAAP